MLKKEHRLKKNKHFKYIYKHGISKHGRMISMVYLKTKFQPYKVGFTVSNKIGKSVIRSKIKRRMREAFRKLEDGVNKNNNYIFIAREGIENLSFTEILTSMKEILKKVGLYEEKQI